ncbi:MAG: hypothetical protein V2I67_03115 [Thermoanaerobaculales bacterium]|jgi:hypothetical protein|nr:hypothetical protein [Thermoanaerobaculales bacterium]
MTDIHRNSRTEMMRKLSQRTALVLLCGLIALIAGPADATSELESATSSALSLTAGEHRQITESMTKAYGNPLTITAADFRSDGVNPSELVHKWPDDALWGRDSQNAFAVAPVYLPDGAAIASVGVAVYDGFGGTTGNCGLTVQRDVWAFLFRINNFTGEHQLMSYFETTGMSPDRQFFLDTEVEHPDVSYPFYSYYAVAKVCHSAHLFYAMQIFFSMP